MADDGLLLNFEVGDTPSIGLTAGKYKGRWKERVNARKWDRIKAKRALNGKPVVQIPRREEIAPKPQPPVEPVRSQGEAGKTNRTTTSDSGPLKRKRKHSVASSANATPLFLEKLRPPFSQDTRRTLQQKRWKR